MLILLTMALLMADPSEWRFDDAVAGKLPYGWSSHKTGEGPDSIWRVVEDAAAKSGKHVLAQTSSGGPRPLFNICVADNATFQDLDLTVAVRPVAGIIDRGGGPVWRFQDANNYYVCRWNPLEDNFRVYKVVNGQRTQLATIDVKIAPDTWHTIRIVHVKDRIRCTLDGEAQLETRDSTFAQAGKVGVWSKADAVSHFDDLTVRTRTPKQD